MELYSDYFQFGVDPKEIQTFAKQDRFLSFSFSSGFISELNPAARRGYKALLDQWIMYTMLHEHVNVKTISIESVHPDKDVFLLTQIASLTISHRSIAILYPHMLHNLDFMDKVVGKQLTFQTRQRALFDSNHQIVSLQPEHSLAQGWNAILNDPVMVARVLSQALLHHPSGYIDSTLDDLTSKTF